ncbi:hypothetical protein NDU88_000509 [Pleurodeles waltl]|uniref:Uncharacterized protein n=1 Tax=Pleurodeles waltl TaxID=8319 RepID=A0AAV7P131_PLEWA|nr:hypothetical protein NDU88_000509 [Pleurodeles waltl]
MKTCPGCPNPSRTESKADECRHAPLLGYASLTFYAHDWAVEDTHNFTASPCQIKNPLGSMPMALPVCFRLNSVVRILYTSGQAGKGVASNAQQQHLAKDRA